MNRSSSIWLMERRNFCGLEGGWDFNPNTQWLFINVRYAYRHTWFYCSLLYCVLQKLLLLQIKGLWQPCVKQVYQHHYNKNIAFPFSRGSSWPRDRTQVSHTAGWSFTSWATREAHIENILIIKYIYYLLYLLYSSHDKYVINRACIKGYLTLEADEENTLT